jgi:pantoate--beta-alanine ligase
VRLSEADRGGALGISRALNAAAAAVAAGERDADAIRVAATAELGDLEAEYLAIVDPVTFAPLRTVSARTLVAIAAQVGPVRLIDNIVLEPVPVAT